MEKFIKETALKAEDILNSVISKCGKDIHPVTAALNAEFALGEYFALMNIIKTYDMDLYVSVAKSTQETKDKLTNITNNMYLIAQIEENIEENCDNLIF